jgi:hypothetical protein
MEKRDTKLSPLYFYHLSAKAQSTAEYILVVFLAGLGAITALNILQVALSTSFLSFVGKFAVEIK